MDKDNVKADAGKAGGIGQAPWVRMWWRHIERSKGFSRGRDRTMLGASFSTCVPEWMSLVMGKMRLKMSTIPSLTPLLKVVQSCLVVCCTSKAVIPPWV